MVGNPFNLSTFQNEETRVYDNNIKPKDIYEKEIIKGIRDKLIEEHTDLLRSGGKDKTYKMILQILCEDYNIREKDESNIISERIMDTIYGYGILQKYIDDESISDIRVTDIENIYVKRKGIWEKTEDGYESKEELINYIRYCILKNNGVISYEKPLAIVSDRKYNLRIEAGIHPVNPISPNLVIRIHRNSKHSKLEDLLMLEDSMFDKEIYKFLISVIESGCNIIICGKGGSGKTTILRAIINKVSDSVAITSNEETVEILCENKNIIQREVISEREAKNNITLDKLTKESLVMSNDLIVIGEIKGEEALAFFDTIATGHTGYTTVHSYNSMGAIDRLVTLMKKDPKAIQYTDKYLRQLLSSTVDIIIYMRNFKVQEIAEVGYDARKQDISYNLLFECRHEKIINRENIGIVSFDKISPISKNAKHKIDRYKREEKG